MNQIWKKRLINFGFFLISTTIVVGGGFLALMAARGNLLTPNGLQPTGTIRLIVDPEDSFAVFLDEQQQTVTNNKTIEGVLPGEYELRIQKDGFNSWQQRVSISQGIITDVYAQLFPTSVSMTQVTTAGVESFTLGRNARVIYYITENTSIGGNIGLWRLNLETGGILSSNPAPVKITNLVPGLREAVSAGTYTLLPSPNDSKLILIIPTGTYLLDADRYNEPVAANKLNLTYSLDKVAWLNESTNLLIQSGNLLLDFDIDKKLASVITFQNDTAPVYTQAANSVYYVTNNKLYKYTAGNNQAVSLENVALPENISRLDAGLLDTSLVVTAENKLYFLDISSSTLTALGAYQLRSIAPSGKDLIVYDGGDVYSIGIVVSQIQGTVNVTRTKTAIANEASKNITWSANSVYFVYYDAENKQLMASSKSGLSVDTLIDNVAPDLAPGQYKITGDSDFILVELEDSNSNGRYNVYKLEL